MAAQSSTLAFHHLSYVDDGDEVVVGRRDIDSYGVFPPDGAALVRKLANGMDLETAAVWYQDTYGTTVDMTDLVDTLRELRLLREHDEPDARPVRWQRLGRWLFSPVAWILYACLVVVAT